MPTRRHIMQGLAAGGALLTVGCVPDPRRPRTPDEVLGDLSTLASDYLNERGPGVVLHVARGEEVLFEGAAGHAAGLSPSEAAAGLAPRPMTLETKVRVASVSKMAVAMTALAAFSRPGATMDTDLAQWWPGLRNPAFPDTPITMAQLLSHTSSLRDPEAYWIAAPGRIETILEGPAFGAQPPGAYFTYCNLNFGVAATILERMTGERFDLLAQRTLNELGLSGGFNWSGVALEDRRAGATLYRLVDRAWAVQTDGPEILEDDEPLWLREDGFTLADYEIGSNGTLFSPQGGLRADVRTIARLAKAVAQVPTLARPVWRHDPNRDNGNVEGGLFEASGRGCFEWTPEASPIRGQRMIGHDGEAYGLYSGAWWLPELDARIGFAITGTPGGNQPPSDHPGYNLWSKTLFDVSATVLGLRGEPA